MTARQMGSQVDAVTVLGIAVTDPLLTIEYGDPEYVVPELELAEWLSELATKAHTAAAAEARRLGRTTVGTCIVQAYGSAPYAGVTFSGVSKVGTLEALGDLCRTLEATNALDLIRSWGDTGPEGVLAVAHLVGTDPIGTVH